MFFFFFSSPSLFLYFFVRRRGCCSTVGGPNTFLSSYYPHELSRGVPCSTTRTASGTGTGLSRPVTGGATSRTRTDHKRNRELFSYKHQRDFGITGKIGKRDLPSKHRFINSLDLVGRKILPSPPSEGIIPGRVWEVHRSTSGSSHGTPDPPTGRTTETQVRGKTTEHPGARLDRQD